MQVVYVPSHLYHMVFELFKVCWITITQFFYTICLFSKIVFVWLSEPILDSRVFLQMQAFNILMVGK